MIPTAAIGDWRELAACAVVDPEVFFVEDAAVAISICSECPVRDACLRAALAEERGSSGAYRHGVRGGLSAQSRARLDDLAGTRRPAQQRSLGAEQTCPDCGRLHTGQRRRCAVCFERLRHARNAD
jgi:WhiB family redox-sensing transcriptional regulator